jgi:DNA-binding transcriptional LysR family regulator
MVPMMRQLDPEAVQAFVHVADLKSFTRAAEALGKTQSTISLKVQRLEACLGRRLLERTPRSVRLSTDGQAFLGPARDFLTAHNRAAEAFEGDRHRVALGISHHLVGPDLPLILKHMNAIDPSCVIEIRVDASNALIRDYDAGLIDGIVLMRQEGDRRDGAVISAEPLGWYGAVRWTHDPTSPPPLATQAAPCGLRSLSIDALKRGKIDWREVFVGGGVAVLGAAIQAGLAVGVLARRMAPVGVEDVGSNAPKRSKHSPIAATTAASSFWSARRSA